MTPTTEQRTCSDCGNAYDHEPLMLSGRDLSDHITICYPCSEKAEQKAKEQESERRSEVLKSRYVDIVAKEYRATDINHPDYPEPVHRAGIKWLKYRFLLKDPKTPLFFGLIGDSGLCKTRVIAQMVKRLIWMEKRVIWVNSANFQWACQNQFSKADGNEASKWLTSYRKAPVLVFDDLGSLKSSEIVSDNFYSLLEHRTSRGLPMLWTSNETLDEILSGLSEKPRMRSISRLAGFSEIISL